MKNYLFHAGIDISKLKLDVNQHEAMIESFCDVKCLKKQFFSGSNKCL